MSYYMRGDYYRGDYYRGDPGIGKFFSGVGKAIAGGVAGFVTGGPMGALVGAGGALMGKGAGGKAGVVGALAGTAVSLMPGGTSTGSSPGFKLGPVTIHPGSILPGGNPFITGSSCERGYHPSKDGSGRCVRNRSMNVGNVKALRRGLRRAEGFEKLARRTVNALHRGPSKFKKRGKKR